MSNYSVTVTKQIAPVDDPLYDRDSVRVQMAVTEVVGFSDKGIFTYELHLVTDEPLFSHVATPTDIQDFNFEIAGDQRFVRQSTVDLVRASATEAEETILDIEARIQQLCNDMNTLDEFDTPVEETFTSL